MKTKRSDDEGVFFLFAVFLLLLELGGSVSVEDETGKSAVFVVVAAVRFASVQLDVDLVSGVQVQDDAVGGVVVVLVGVLSDGARPHLRERERETGRGRSTDRSRFNELPFDVFFFY